MWHDLRRHSRKMGITFLLVLSILLSVLPAGVGNTAKSVALSISSPAQKLFYRFSLALAGMHDWFCSRAQLAGEKKELEAELLHLQNLWVRLQDELLQERLKVRALGAFKALPEADKFTPVVEAEVIGRDSSKLRESVVIDRGSAHGLEPGMPVVWGQALVGKLAVVAPWASQVQLLTDPEFKVSCYLLGSRARGLATGASRDGLTISYIGGKVKVMPGEMVLSSGEGGIFPKGLIVGYITGVEQPDLFKVVQLQPQAKLDRLEMVLILLQKKRSFDAGSKPK